MSSPLFVYPFSYPLHIFCTLIIMLERQVTKTWWLPSWSLQPVEERGTERIPAHIIKSSYLGQAPHGMGL